MRIIFYDGDCGFCSAWVHFVLRYDTNGHFYFAPLQGETAQSHLPQHLRFDLSTLVVKDSDHLYTKSNAVLQILLGLGGVWRVGAVFWLIPRLLRDLVYDAIARFRHRLNTASCLLPTPEHRSRFLD